MYICNYFMLYISYYENNNNYSNKSQIKMKQQEKHYALGSWLEFN